MGKISDEALSPLLPLHRAISGKLAFSMIDPWGHITEILFFNDWS